MKTVSVIFILNSGIKWILQKNLLNFITKMAITSDICILIDMPQKTDIKTKNQCQHLSYTNVVSRSVFF